MLGDVLGITGVFMPSGFTVSGAVGARRRVGVFV